MTLFTTEAWEAGRLRRTDFLSGPRSPPDRRAAACSGRACSGPTSTALGREAESGAAGAPGQTGS